MTISKKLQERIEELIVAKQLGLPDSAMRSKKEVLTLLATDLHADLKLAMEALEYYAKGEHYDGDWENPSGEPQNLLCLNETDEWHWVESGAFANKHLSTLKEKYGEKNA